MSELATETKRLSPIDELISPTVRVIREVYEGENAHEMFQSDLNKALFDKVRFIVIEPTRLGEETERWIAVGNCLHKTSLVSSAASIAISLIWRERLTIYSASFCAVSMFCTSLYAICWTCDPCVEYQVERKQRNLMKIPVPEGASSPVVLVHTGNRLATYSHRIMTALATSVCVWTVYRALK
ncbi:transmembrane protein 11 homolog, mitochondrial isoform X1 [Anopheles maculipalpis]|uniref:transmembrane protein 11 homolog, mitochondrial isoform X1 n=1 Tax=Anopheles maculipalpis TaxID=1496333 RepID=UPI0021599006|nr:transmembrane protein 11 homolog, mitochondrial isoform X1 [Anopheles maculipalpis]